MINSMQNMSPICSPESPGDILVGRVGEISFAKHNVQNYVNDF